jgi:DNA-binding transcriptional LysR family regulator
MSNLTVQSLVRRVDLFTLKLFLSTIEEGQIGRAAFREHVVPSAATKRFQDLEDAIGMKLFDRTARGVAPSQAGVILARHVRDVMSSLEELFRELGELSEGVRGRVAVAAPGILIAQFLAYEIGAFMRRFPQVEVNIFHDQNAMVLRALRNGEVDFAVFSHVKGEVYQGIESVECRRDRLVLLVPEWHPLSPTLNVSLEAVLDQELVSFGEGTTVMNQLRHAALQIGREPRVRYTVSAVDAVRSMVSAGLGVALLPASIAQADGHQNVRIVPIDGDWAERSYRVGYLSGRAHSPAAEALINQIISPTAD